MVYCRIATLPQGDYMQYTKERDIQLTIESESQPTKQSSVFYNPAMQRNRDISVSCLSSASQDSNEYWEVGDPLAGTGIRGLRYLTEVASVSTAHLNDSNPRAVENIRMNCRYNAISQQQAHVSQQDANATMHQHRNEWNYVDIDPFGSPRPYLDAAATVLRKSSAIGVTATDLAVVCGAYPQTCRRRYAATPLKTQFCHEIGLRIYLASAFMSCAHRDKCLIPRLCWYEQHYIRLFGTVQQSAKQTNKHLSCIGYLSYCNRCLYRRLEKTTVATCPHCDSALQHAGPLWIGSFADPAFGNHVLADLEEREYTDAATLIRSVVEEASITQPYYNIHQLAKYAKTNAVKRDQLCEFIQSLGYQCAPTHFSPIGIRTNCHIDQLYDAMQTL